MTKKLGPLPVWAWGLILGVAGYFAYARYKENEASTSSSSTSTLDPNSVDPNTGLTYGQEEDAALNADATSAANGSQSGGSTTTSPAESISQEVSDVTGLITSLESAGLITAPSTSSNGSGSSSSGSSSSGSSSGNSSSSSGGSTSTATTPGATASTPATVPTTNKATIPTITTHVGGQFYDWYKSIFGTAPPTTVAVNNPVYVDWTQGVAKATVKKLNPGGIGAAKSTGGAGLAAK